MPTIEIFKMRCLIRNSLRPKMMCINLRIHFFESLPKLFELIRINPFQSDVKLYGLHNKGVHVHRMQITTSGAKQAQVRMMKGNNAEWALAEER